VKNTGRCKELLIPGVQVILEKSSNPERSTAYDLVAVWKGNRLINMDSQAPNKVVGEWLSDGGLFSNIKLIKPETTWGNSRFDFYVEYENKKAFMEVKGVTLEQDGVVRFPDAPSERAVKHVEELMEAKKEGFEVYVLLVVQMKNVKYFVPNWETHPEFCQALLKAREAGVKIMALDCDVKEDSMRIADKVPVYLEEREAIAAYMAEPLLEYYDAHRRILPWREEPTAYRVWVSEIMLQQTRVEAVKPYFARFMEALPDIKSLAEAEEEQLLKLWEGLGYYSRVRNLGKAAKVIMEEYGGVMPSDIASLLKLPGIGSYTAGAVASIAYGVPAPAVDGNVLRVMSRIFEDDRDVLSAAVKKDWEGLINHTMSKDRPGDFNQAMMEIGAMVCVPNGAPKCELCPFNQMCQAHLHGTELQYPYKAPKKQRVIEERTVLILRDEDKTALVKRPAKGLLAGMYEFPIMEGHVAEESVIQFLKEKGLDTLWITPLEDAKHIFSHKEWHMKGYMIRVDELTRGETPKEWLFVEPKETEESYPIPSAYAKYMKYLQVTVGHEVFRNTDF
jgi:A/G-specific adenine glycosylase/sugar fermentation stimulation protein